MEAGTYAARMQTARERIFQAMEDLKPGAYQTLQGAGHKDKNLAVLFQFETLAQMLEDLGAEIAPAEEPEAEEQDAEAPAAAAKTVTKKSAGRPKRS